MQQEETYIPQAGVLMIRSTVNIRPELGQNNRFDLEFREGDALRQYTKIAILRGGKTCSRISDGWTELFDGKRHENIYGEVTSRYPATDQDIVPFLRSWNDGQGIRSWLREVEALPTLLDSEKTRLRNLVFSTGDITSREMKRRRRGLAVDGLVGFSLAEAIALFLWFYGITDLAFFLIVTIIVLVGLGSSAIFLFLSRRR